MMLSLQSTVPVVRPSSDTAASVSLFARPSRPRDLHATRTAYCDTSEKILHLARYFTRDILWDSDRGRFWAYPCWISEVGELGGQGA